MQKKGMYLELRLIKQYGASGRSFFLMLKLLRKKRKKKKKKKKKKKERKKKEMNKHAYGVAAEKPHK